MQMYIYCFLFILIKTFIATAGYFWNPSLSLIVYRYQTRRGSYRATNLTQLNMKGNTKEWIQALGRQSPPIQTSEHAGNCIEPSLHSGFYMEPFVLLNHVETSKQCLTII